MEVFEIHAALNKMYRTGTVDSSTVESCLQRFRNGRISTDNNPRSDQQIRVKQTMIFAHNKYKIIVTN